MTNNLQKSVEIGYESGIIVRNEIGLESEERSQLPADAAEYETDTTGARRSTWTTGNSDDTGKMNDER